MRRAAICALFSIVLPNCAFAVPAAAQDDSATSGNASASVVRPIGAVPQAELAFGAIVVGASADGTVAVYPADGVPGFTGSVRPACGGGSACGAHPARFSVSGEPGQSYRIMLPLGLQASGRRTGHLLDVFDLQARSVGNPASDNGGQLDMAGEDSFAVGGRLSVGAGSPADIYSADLPVTVSYD